MRTATQNLRILRADWIERIPLRRNTDELIHVRPIRRAVDKRQLEFDRAVEVIEEITPAIEHRGFILVGTQLVVYVLEYRGFRVNMLAYTTDSIGEHPLKRNAVLCG